jgi:hypothetical protein
VKQAGALSDAEIAGLRAWMRAYLRWLETSPQGNKESHQRNNHGTMFDLQAAAIGQYVGNPAVVVRVFRRARERMLIQFDGAGGQPEELQRTMTRHYCCFNLQGWVTLARIASSVGDDLWSHTTSDGRGIGIALAWLIAKLGSGEWPYADSGAFEKDRLDPLIRDFERHYGSRADGTERFEGRALYCPTAGIAPYWMLAR